MDRHICTFVVPAYFLGLFIPSSTCRLPPPHCCTPPLYSSHSPLVGLVHSLPHTTPRFHFLHTHTLPSIPLTPPAHYLSPSHCPTRALPRSLSRFALQLTFLTGFALPDAPGLRSTLGSAWLDVGIRIYPLPVGWFGFVDAWLPLRLHTCLPHVLVTRGAHFQHRNSAHYDIRRPHPPPLRATPRTSPCGYAYLSTTAHTRFRHLFTAVPRHALTLYVGSLTTPSGTVTTFVLPHVATCAMRYVYAPVRLPGTRARYVYPRHPPTTTVNIACTVAGWNSSTGLGNTLVSPVVPVVVVNVVGWSRTHRTPPPPPPTFTARAYAHCPLTTTPLHGSPARCVVLPRAFALALRTHTPLPHTACAFYTFTFYIHCSNLHRTLVAGWPAPTPPHPATPRAFPALRDILH